MKNIERPMDFEIFFDEKGFIETEITRGSTQDKINNLLSLQEEYDYLEKLNKDLKKLLKIKKKTKKIRDEIDDLYTEIDSQEEYIKYFLTQTTIH